MLSIRVEHASVIATRKGNSTIYTTVTQGVIGSIGLKRGTVVGISTKVSAIQARYAIVCYCLERAYFAGLISAEESWLAYDRAVDALYAACEAHWLSGMH